MADFKKGSTVPVPLDEHNAPAPTPLLDVLLSEQESFAALCDALSGSDWDRPTPSVGWSVRDQVAHLADTEEIAHHTTTGGPRMLALEIERHGADGGVTAFGVGRGRSMRSGGDVLGWWKEASATNVAGLASVARLDRIPWGLGMSWRSFLSARTMEHWAHGLDVAAAVGALYPDSARLEHVAYLCYRSLPYAFGIAGIEPPHGRRLRVHLTGPGGEAWTYGPADATDFIEGEAGVWCRRAVHRISVAEADDLAIEGPLAELAVRHARAFL